MVLIRKTRYRKKTSILAIETNIIDITKKYKDIN